MMIGSSKCADTEAPSKGVRVTRFVRSTAGARRKLRQLEIATRLDDLKVPPGHRPGAFKGKRSGQYSIRINDQWRICFRLANGIAETDWVIDLGPGPGGDAGGCIVAQGPPGMLVCTRRKSETARVLRIPASSGDRISNMRL